MEKISVVVSCYNEEEALPLFYEEITKVAEKMNYVEYEFVFVNDGSADKTIDVIRDLSNKDNRVRYVSFSRNFGKEAAMYAGLKKTTGDYVAIMDADLQDPPRLLEEMYDIVSKKEYDCVATRRVTRKGEPLIRSFCARMFYKLINKISQTEIVDGARDFRFMTRQMADAIISIDEYNRFSKGIFEWVGFKTKWLEYENIERVAGETTWSFWKLFKYAIEGIIAFTTVPLVISIVLGLLFCIIALILLIIYIVKVTASTEGVFNWLLICIISFVSGVQLFCTGILGLYLSKTYLEIKKRPIYIIKEEK